MRACPENIKKQLPNQYFQINEERKLAAVLTYNLVCIDTKSQINYRNETAAKVKPVHQININLAPSGFVCPLLK